MTVNRCPPVVVCISTHRTRTIPVCTKCLRTECQYSASTNFVELCIISLYFCSPDHIDKNEAYLGRGQCNSISSVRTLSARSGLAQGDRFQVRPVMYFVIRRPGTLLYAYTSLHKMACRSSPSCFWVWSVSNGIYKCNSLNKYIHPKMVSNHRKARVVGGKTTSITLCQCQCTPSVIIHACSSWCFVVGYGWFSCCRKCTKQVVSCFIRASGQRLLLSTTN